MPSRSSKAKKRGTRAELLAEVARLNRRVVRLEGLCSEMYQIAGTVGAPVAVMDKLWAAASGKRIPRIELLPVTVNDFAECVPRARSEDVALSRVSQKPSPARR